MSGDHGRRCKSKYDQIPGATIVAVNAPPIMGLSTTGGFNFELQDLNAAGVEALAEATQNFVEQAKQRPELTGVYTTFNPHVPQRFLEIDRVKAKTRGVSIGDIFDTLQINLGLLVRQRVQQIRAGLSGLSAGGAGRARRRRPTSGASRSATRTAR